jgi:hypothetical protein
MKTNQRGRFAPRADLRMDVRFWPRPRENSVGAKASKGVLSRSIAGWVTDGSFIEYLLDIRRPATGKDAYVGARAGGHLHPTNRVLAQASMMVSPSLRVAW